MEYYSAIRQNEIIWFAGKCIEPEIILSSKTSQVSFNVVTLSLCVPSQILLLMLLLTYFIHLDCFYLIGIWWVPRSSP
jgi:hypothetical protein